MKQTFFRMAPFTNFKSGIFSHIRLFVSKCALLWIHKDFVHQFLDAEVDEISLSLSVDH
jgi:hypothetical protein